MSARLIGLTCLLAYGAAAIFSEPAAPGEAGACAAWGCVTEGDDAKPSSSDSIKIVWKRDVEGKSKTGKTCVDVSGVDAALIAALAAPKLTTSQWSSFFSVRVSDHAKSADPDTPPLWGSYELKGELIRFVPRFPPDPGVRYLAEFDPAKLPQLAKELDPSRVVGEPTASEERVTAEFLIDKPPAKATTKITAVYPSGATLPENLLRFYIHFSAPMSRGGAYRHLKLIEVKTGKTVQAPFLELEEELWSPDGTRFTLFFDPGRVKRGLAPRELFGPVLEAGKSYCLIIARDWTDAAGNVLKSEFRRTFRAGAADETMPDPKKWSVKPPQGGSGGARGAVSRAAGSSPSGAGSRRRRSRREASIRASLDRRGRDGLAVRSRGCVARGNLPARGGKRAGRRGGQQRGGAVRG